MWDFYVLCIIMYATHADTMGKKFVVGELLIARKTFIEEEKATRGTRG